VSQVTSEGDVEVGIKPTTCPSGAVVAQPICNRQVGGFESPLGLHNRKKGAARGWT
jgi:hypothetical protein